MSDVVTYTCPRCGRTSANPHDVLHGYCGHCKDWTRGTPEHEALMALRDEPDILFVAMRADGLIVAVTKLATGFQVSIGDGSLKVELWDYPPSELGPIDLCMANSLSSAMILLVGGEPVGWYRHRPSNRRRPGGDPTREFVRA